MGQAQLMLCCEPFRQTIEESMGLFRRLTERLQAVRTRLNSRLAVIRKSMLQLKNWRKTVAIIDSDAVDDSEQLVALPSALSKWMAATKIDCGVPAIPSTSPSSSVNSSLQVAPHCLFIAADTPGDASSEYSEEEEEEVDSLDDFDWDMSIGSDSVFTDTLSYNDETWNMLVPEDDNSNASSLTISSRGISSLASHMELAPVSDNEDNDCAERHMLKRAMSDTELNKTSSSTFINSHDSGRFTVHQDYPTKHIDGSLLVVSKLTRPLLPMTIYKNDWYSPPKNFRPKTTILTARHF